MELSKSKKLGPLLCAGLKSSTRPTTDPISFKLFDRRGRPVFRMVTTDSDFVRSIVRRLMIDWGGEFNENSTIESELCRGRRGGLLEMRIDALDRYFLDGFTDDVLMSSMAAMARSAITKCEFSLSSGLTSQLI